MTLYSTTFRLLKRSDVSFTVERMDASWRTSAGDSRSTRREARWFYSQLEIIKSSWSYQAMRWLDSVSDKITSLIPSSLESLVWLLALSLFSVTITLACTGMSALTIIMAAVNVTVWVVPLVGELAYSLVGVMARKIWKRIDVSPIRETLHAALKSAGHCNDLFNLRYLEELRFDSISDLRTIMDDVIFFHDDVQCKTGVERWAHRVGKSLGAAPPDMKFDDDTRTALYKCLQIITSMDAGKTSEAEACAALWGAFDADRWKTDKGMGSLARLCAVDLTADDSLSARLLEERRLAAEAAGRLAPMSNAGAKTNEMLVVAGGR